MDIQKGLDESIAELDNLLLGYEEINAIQNQLHLELNNLEMWINQWKILYQIIRKKTYTVAETTFFANALGCDVVRVKTKYSLVLISNKKVLFTGVLTEIVDYCFNNLIKKA